MLVYNANVQGRTNYNCEILSGRCFNVFIYGCYDQVLPNLVTDDFLPCECQNVDQWLCVREKQEVKHHFNLGMGDWNEAENKNAPSRKTLSLSKSKPQAASHRWKF